jgi:hypothetical protein
MMLLWNTSRRTAVRLVVLPAIWRDEAGADYSRHGPLTAK